MNTLLLAVLLALPFRELWAVDFEFTARPGENVTPICLVAKELRSQRTVRLWEDDLHGSPRPPYSTGSDVLFVAYYAAAEMSCHLALDWPLPENVLDLFTEFRNRTNGLATQCGSGLLGALAHFGLPGLDAIEKDSMRQLAIRGGPWTQDERGELLDYCETDVVALERLLPSMVRGLDLPRALVRGHYMKAVARMESTGIPIDVEKLSILRARWQEIRERLVHAVDAGYGIYEGTTFKADRWAAWLEAHAIAWPRLEWGRLALDDNTFRDVALAHPEVNPIRELRVSQSQMRLSDLAVGADGRNRCMLSAFRSRTGRNQPSNTKFIFGPAVWLRSLIRPLPGYGLAYVDWSQQEFGIAAALSGDATMLSAYTWVIRTWSLRNSVALLPSQPQNTRTVSSANSSRRACSPRSTAWKPTRLRIGSEDLLPTRENCSISIGGPTVLSGDGPMQRSTTRCCMASSTPRSVGRFMLVSTRRAAPRPHEEQTRSTALNMLRTHVRSEIFSCKGMAQRCFAWPPASPPNVG